MPKNLVKFNAGSGPHRAQKIKNEIKRILKYWTPERIKNAKPFQSYRVGKPLKKKLTTLDSFTTNPLPDNLVPPFSGIGHLTMTFNSIGDQQGTAWCVANNVILTAGHCLFQGNEMAHNVLFYPCYNNEPGQIPNPTGPAIPILDRWVHPDYAASHPAGNQTDKQISCDIGACHTSSPMFPRSIPSIKLVKKWTVNVGSSIHMDGYPAEPVSGYPFDGNHMWDCYDKIISNGDKIYSSHGNLTGGSSGGPWIFNVDANTWVALGLTSCNNSTPSDPSCTQMYSPISAQTNNLENAFNEISSWLEPGETFMVDPFPQNHNFKRK